MRRLISGLVILAAAGWAIAGHGAPTKPAPARPAPVQVMVLGAYHFDNPGLDLRNIAADDPTSPRRQRELAALADALLRFRPTRVMIEAQSNGPDFDVPDYRAFTPARLASDRSETVQIGYRVANRAGLAAVQGIDEQPGPGEPDYFPFDRVESWAKANYREADLAALFGEVDHDLKIFQAAQQRETIPALLLRHNSAQSVARGHGLYTALLAFGDRENQPGAELNAYWYMRNAKIFGKLMLASRPGDRVLVIFGSGHGYWLRQLAATTPGYVSVDVVPYLESADRQARR